MKTARIRWFTLIEVMIAIGVFSIWILAVLQMIIKNLSVVDSIKLRSSATILAKEGIELAYNIRDANLDKWLNWDCLLSNDIYSSSQESLNTEQNICNNSLSGVIQLSFSPQQYIYSKIVSLHHDFLQDFDENQLYASSGNFYSNDIQALEHPEKSFYSRYLIFKPVIENHKILSGDKIRKIESHVLIRKWWYTGEVVLESLLWNY